MAEHAAPTRPQPSSSPEETQFVIEDIEQAGIKPEHPDSEPKRPLSASWRAEPLSPTEKAKVASIIKACERRDLEELGRLAATKDGFVEDEIRRRAWPVLLGCDDALDGSDDWKILPPHHDEPQVALDVNRAFVYYPRNETDAVLATRRTALSNLITATLRTHPSLSYFQGYHDIAQVLLLVLGLPSANPALARLSLLKIRDFMLPTMTGTSSHLDLIPPILYASDPHLCRHLSGLQPFFALAATLTMFAHDIEEYGGIARLFDYLLARDAAASVYMFAAIVSLRRDELLEIEAEEPEMLYAVLSKLPKPLDLEALIRRTEGLMVQHPPEKLPLSAWRRVSEHSVLKTTKGERGIVGQSLEDGERWLDLQAKEIERQEARKAAVERMKKTARRYQRPASVVALTVLVGVLSVWLGRNGPGPSHGVFRMLSGLQQRALYSIGQVLGFRM